MIAPQRSRLWSLLSLAVLIAGFGWIGWSRVPADATLGPVSAPQAGFLAPEFSLPALDGNTIHLSNLRGRPVLVNVWASWCPPCKAEMPAIQAVQDRYRDQGLVVLAVNAATQDTPEAARLFIETGGYTFPVLLDIQGEVTRNYRIHSLPTSFFIDTEGIIREVVVGGPMAEALLRIRIEGLLEYKQGGLP